MTDRNRPDRDRSTRRGPGRRPAEEHSTPDAPGADEALVIVRFKGHRKSYYNNRRDLDLAVGQYCLVDADRGRDLGQITYVGQGRAEWWQDAVYQGVLALARPEDMARVPELRREEHEAWDISLEKIQDHGLDMHLVGIERRWDRNKLTFYFLADERVDFRALVRDLAGVFRTRIELRQIGVRDEARLKGGIGICGREFCCATFLPNFVSVALRMAKDQQLPLNPAKLSGPCGRLRCCLAYEHASYRRMLSELPKLNSEVVWEERPGKVRKIDPMRGVVTVQLLDNGHEVVEASPDELIFETPAAVADTRTQDGESARRRPRRRSGRRRSGAETKDGER